MAYIKQEFQAGEILTAKALNAMDEQVYQNSQVNELTEEKITNILGYTPANKDTVDTQATEIDNLETSVKENATDISTLKTSVERNATDIDELNTNKIKVKTKRYQITAVYDSNIQLYKASISIANDIPAGNILTTLITGSNSTGYAEYGPRWFLYDSNIICNAELPGTFMATVTWLYL